jgi:hypothetical protein
VWAGWAGWVCFPFHIDDDDELGSAVRSTKTPQVLWFLPLISKLYRVGRNLGQMGFVKNYGKCFH